MLISGLLLGTVIVLTLLLLKSRRTYEEELEKATVILEQVIQDDFSIESLTYKEGQEAKLAFKAMRVAEINREYARQAAEEQTKTQELVADISHQMRTPLSSIMMYLELLEDEQLPQKEQKEFLNRVSASSAKLSWLISEFITIARFEAKAMKVQITDGQLNETIYQAIDMNSEQARKKRIRFSFQPKTAISLPHDAHWTREAISNILDNAVKYSPDGSEVKIEIEQLVFYTRIRIINSGRTLSASEQLLVFQKYYRGTNAGKEEGAGIGLYLVKLIVEEQGGYSVIESRNDKTTISLFLLN